MESVLEVCVELVGEYGGNGLSHHAQISSLQADICVGKKNQPSLSCSETTYNPIVHVLVRGRYFRVLLYTEFSRTATAL